MGNRIKDGLFSVSVLFGIIFFLSGFSEAFPDIMFFVPYFYSSRAGILMYFLLSFILFIFAIRRYISIKRGVKDEIQRPKEI